jgi:hypothetical protein
MNPRTDQQAAPIVGGTTRTGIRKMITNQIGIPDQGKMRAYEMDEVVCANRSLDHHPYCDKAECRVIRNNRYN